MFWVDGRMCVGSLLTLFPRVFTVVSNKEAFVKEYYVMEGTRVVCRVEGGCVGLKSPSTSLC